MKRIPFGDRRTSFLLLICVLLAIIVAMEWSNLEQQTGIGTWLESDPASTIEVSPARTAYVTPDIKIFDEILERPLFLEKREPPPVQSDPVKARSDVKKARLRLQLEGLAITPEIRIAVVCDLGNKKLLKLEEGMEHQGWVLESVNTASVHPPMEQPDRPPLRVAGSRLTVPVPRNQPRLVTRHSRSRRPRAARLRMAKRVTNNSVATKNIVRIGFRGTRKCAARIASGSMDSIC